MTAATPRVGSGVTGRYIANRRAKQSGRASYDATVAARLWQMNCELVGLGGRPGDPQ
jgi:retinol dehydrogenase-14